MNATATALRQSSAVILARVSSKSQEDEGYSLDSQLKLLTGYCKNKDLNVVKVFKIAETASKQQSRKVFHEMLTYISKNKVYHLAVEKTDRFTRNFRDAVAIDDWLDKDANRRLHAVKENILLHKEAKSDVKFMWNINLSVAKKYTDNLREEAMKGWAEKLAQGWLPGVPPPGYMTVTENGKRIHIPNPDTESLIKRAFEFYLNPNQSIASLALEMDQMGIRTRKGRPYVKSKVQKMLNNPFYIGINLHNGIEYPGAQQPIIDRDIFDRVQTKLHRGRPPLRSKHNPVFKNMIHCADCGGVVTWQLQKGYYYGACQRKSEACRNKKFLRQDLSEELIVKQLQKLVCPSQEIIDWVASTMHERNKDNVENYERISASILVQLERVKRMDNNLYDDKLSGDIIQEKYKEKHEQLTNETTELNEKLDQIDGSLGLRLEHKLVLLELSQKAAQIYQSKSPDNKRMIISKLFEHLTVKEGVLSVKYTKFAQVIAENVEETYKIMEDQK